jgi:hypothetical protein
MDMTTLPTTRLKPTRGHSETPWEAIRQFTVNGDMDHLHYEIRPVGWGAGRIAIVTEGNADPKPNAEFIVRACNTHERLMALARDLALLDSGPERPGELARLHDAARAIVVEVER